MTVLSADALQEAAMGVLEPLLRAVPGQDVSAGLADAIDRCAATARDHDLRSIGYLSAIVVPFLRRRTLSIQLDPGRELIEVWVNDLLSFCAGQLPVRRVRSLVDQLGLWPKLNPLPPEFTEMIVERLQRDAQAIRAWNSSQDEAQDRPQDQAQDRTHDKAQDGTKPIGERQRPVTPDAQPASADLELAVDELELLAQASAAFEERVISVLLAEPARDALAADTSRSPAFLEDYAAELEHMGNALEFVGLIALQEALLQTAVAIRAQVSHGEQLADRLHRGLVELPMSLRAYFTRPDRISADDLVTSVRFWLGDAAQALMPSLVQIQVVASRQILPRLLQASREDLSIAVPLDADTAVVAQLKREMPKLCEAFAQCIDEVRAGKIEKLADAQRIAHTLKGAANTVGVRGIATLTHQLEDLLQLVQASGRVSPPGLLDLLARAADSLSELNEALLGIAATPTDIGQLHEALVEWINRLAQAGEPLESVATEAARPEAGQADEQEHLEAVCPQTALTAPTDALADIADSSAAAESGPQILQIPATLMERMLEAITEASIKLAQMQEHIGQIDSTRHSLRSANEGLQTLSGELERLVDVRGVALTGRSGTDEFDPLELDEYNDLHTLSRRIVEAGADHRIIDRNFDHHVLELNELSDQVERLQVDLRGLVHSTRLVAVHSMVPRLNRAVRQAARMAGRVVELQVAGAHTEIDGEMLQSLVDSLTQLLRNAVDHGIEPAATRIANGKSANGKIVLRFSRAPEAIHIECIDDGAGIDLLSVRSRAESLGCFAPGAEFDPVLNPIDEAQLMRLIFRPGFSTRQSVTQLSGRGIGLDVVHQAVKKLHGQIDVQNSPGTGACFRISIAAKAASQPVMVIQDARYCLALIAHDIDEILAARSLASNDQAQPIALTVQGPVDVVVLSDLLGLPRNVFAADASDSMVLVVRLADGRRVGIVSPPLIQARNILVRPIPDWLATGAGVTGLAVLGDGSVAPVLDLPALLAAPGEASGSALTELSFEDISLPICLVVDDSVSVRRSMELFLNDLGLRVITAADGVQALDRVRRYRPAVVIADLEMPRMNGIEFAKAMRADAQFAEIPIIMITSRFSQKHRTRALQAGVTVFMTKPYTEDAVASEIQRCLAPANDG